MKAKKKVSGRQGKKPVADILSALKKEGAAQAREIRVGDVVLDERVRLKCQIPLCDSYGRNLMCPPNLPPVEEFRKSLARFSTALLLQVSAPVRGPSAAGPSKDVFAPAKQLHELVNRGEKMAFEKGFHFATGLIGGCCRLCDECVAVRGEKKCRFPFKARPSMEAMGIDVSATLETTGLAVTFPISDRVVWTGLILL